MSSPCDYHHPAPFRHFTCSKCEVEHNKPNDNTPFTSQYRTLNEMPCCASCWWVSFVAALQEQKDITEFATQMTQKDKEYLRKMLPK